MGRAATWWTWIGPWRAVVALAMVGLSTPAAAQTADQEEIDLIQRASQQEAAGELDAAERLLRAALEKRAASAPALLSLERVLRIQGRLDGLPPLVETALESDPESTLLNQLLVRSYSELDRVAELERAGERWMRAVPGTEIPYREVARVWSSRGEYGRARAVLEEGRRRVGIANALALELGDLYAAVGEPVLAIREWERSIGPTGRGLSQVRRRLRAMPDAGASLAPELVDLLAADGSAAGRLDAAIELAVEAGLEPRARTMTEGRLPALSDPEQRSLLHRLARRADRGGHRVLAHWAYERLLNLDGVGQSQGARVALRERLAELALELGDTAAAAGGYQAVEEAGAPGSEQRRHATAARIELLAAQDPDLASRSLAAFRAEHSGSPETDRLTAAVAEALLDRARVEEAESLLVEADGPLSGRLRGRLMLLRGDVAAARREFLNAAPALRGVEATAALSMVTLLGHVSAESAVTIGEALAFRDRGEPGAAVDRVRSRVDTLPSGDRPPLLEFVAGLAAEAGLTEDARDVWRRLVTEHPRSREAPGALLALARDLAGDAGGEAEARELLERLIIEYPRSALVPQARRALDRLEGRGEA